jgi:hypothetical protein
MSNPVMHDFLQKKYIVMHLITIFTVLHETRVSLQYSIHNIQPLDSVISSSVQEILTLFCIFFISACN